MQTRLLHVTELHGKRVRGAFYPFTGVTQPTRHVCLCIPSRREVTQSEGKSAREGRRDLSSHNDCQSVSIIGPGNGAESLMW